MVGLVLATPPACFLSCINEVSKSCEFGHVDLRCLCGRKDEILGCLVDICPYGTFESSRDHYLGTCLEHNLPAHQAPPPETEISTETDCDTVTKTQHLTDTDCDPATKTETASEPTETDCNEEDWEVSKWEEEEYTDANGMVIAIRKPLNVPAKYLQPTEPKKRILIIKTLKSEISQQSFDPSKDLTKTKFTEILNKKLHELKSKTLKSPNLRNSNLDYKLTY